MKKHILGIFGISIFAITLVLAQSVVPLDSLYRVPKMDIGGDNDGASIVNCLHGGTCPEGITYESLSTPITSSTPQPTVTTTTVSTAPGSTSQNTTAKTPQKKIDYLTSFMLYRVIYDDGTYTEDSISSAKLTPVRLYELSIGNTNTEKIMAMLRFEPVVDMHYNKDLQITGASVKYDLFIATKDTKQILDAKTITTFNVADEYLRFSSVSIPYKTIYDKLRTIPGDPSSFIVGITVSGNLLGKDLDAEMRGNIPEMTLIKGFSVSGGNKISALTDQQTKDLNSEQQSKASDVTLCQVPADCKANPLGNNTLMIIVIAMISMVAVAVVFIWRKSR